MSVCGGFEVKQGHVERRWSWISAHTAFVNNTNSEDFTGVLMAGRYRALVYTLNAKRSALESVHGSLF